MKNNAVPQTLHYLDKVFYPRSIAIIGASTDEQKESVGWTGRLLEFGYKGQLYPINPRGTTILGFKAYPSVKNVPRPVDYAIISVKAVMVPQALKDCIAKGVKVVHIYTAGFAETDSEEGKRLQREIEEVIKLGGTRVIGPNCMGVYSPASGLTFSTRFSREAGAVSVVSQTGAGLMSLIPHANANGIRFSKVVSYGNALDMDSPDFLEYLADDSDTRLVFCYVEGVNDGHRFFTAVRECIKTKPVVILKGGLTEGGSGAVASHTASLAGSEQIWRAFFKQTGAISVDTFDEAIEQMVALQKIPPLCGCRVGIVARGGGPGVIATDICERAGLSVPKLTPEIRSQLAQITPAGAGSSVRNPVEIGLGRYGVSKDYENGLRLVASDPGIDFLITQLDPSSYIQYGIGAEQIEEATEVLVNSAKTLPKPMVVVITLGDTPEIMELVLKVQQKCLNAGVAVFSSMEKAIKAISRLVHYYEYRELNRQDNDPPQV